ncbi:MAG TPA: ATP synthase subunit I [Negativicutes bacterium]|nr:ATP synthase subunit I [Negativicutes bacterium]
MSRDGQSGVEREFAAGVKSLLVSMAALIALIAAGLLVAGHGEKIPGLVVGAVTSVVYLLLICYRVRRAASLPTREAVAYMRTGWFLRLAFIVLMMAVALKVPAVDFVFAVVGLLSLQIAIFLNGLFLVVKRSMTK